MENINIVSTPDITRNIGSCTTQSVKVQESLGIFREVGTTYTTNSCTGEVITAPYSTVSVSFVNVLSIALLFLVIYWFFKLMYDIFTW